MKAISVIVAVFISIVVGIGIGSIPFIQDHLHWNISGIIPITGAILGACLAWLQFMVCYFLQTRVTKVMVVLFSLSAAAAYVALDLGFFLTSMIPDTNIKIREVMTFSDFMSLRLSGIKNVILFVVDLLAAGVADFGITIIMRENYPYCTRCGLYRNQIQSYTILPDTEEEALKNVLASIAELHTQQKHDELTRYLDSLQKKQQFPNSQIKITANERGCSKCGELLLLGKVHRKSGDDWKEMDELAFTTKSQSIAEAKPSTAW
jgi:hypothetical protein